MREYNYKEQRIIKDQFCLGKPNTPAPADYTQPVLTMADYLDFYRAFTHVTDDPREVAAMDDDELAEQVADLIGDCYAAGNFPRDMEDGCIDLYGIVAGIKAAARELIQQQGER
jgi:hypothetical protein